MMTFLNTFRKVGGEFDDRRRRASASGTPAATCSSIALETDVHPGFMTDWQQPLVVALTQANGLSIVHETVYENRFGFTDALNQMGATIQVYRECLGGSPCRFGQRNFLHSAVISGPTPLAAADIEVPDLRGGFSHLIAALAAKGTSTVHGIGLIDRGYEHFTDEARGARRRVQPRLTGSIGSPCNRRPDPIAPTASSRHIVRPLMRAMTRHDWSGTENFPRRGRVHRRVEPHDEHRPADVRALPVGQRRRAEDPGQGAACSRSRCSAGVLRGDGADPGVPEHRVGGGVADGGGHRDRRRRRASRSSPRAR